MWKNRLIYLVALVLLCIFRVAYTGYVAGLMLLCALILPVFSWIISLPGAIYTRISLSAPDQVTRGSEAAVSLLVQQSRLFATGPIRGHLRMQSSGDGAHHTVRLKRNEETFPLDTSHCCDYDCSFRRFRVMDLMGLLPMPTRVPQPIHVAVLPLPQEPPEHPDWASSSNLVTKPFTGGENPYDLRDYRAGDPLKAIHWKKSAALDKTVVRDTLEPYERIAPIWLDWPEDPDGRDAALDQLAWCLIYLKQNNAGLLLQWRDRQGVTRNILAQPGQLDGVLSEILRQPPGQMAPLSAMSQRDILLSADFREGAAT